MNLNQLWALVRLRFQLSSNQIRKGGQVNSILFSIFSVAMILFVVATFLSAIAFGAIWMRKPDPGILMIWNLLVVGFLVMWCFHVMNRIQQNDSISIDRLLHLPMTFQGAFLLNFVGSISNLTFWMIAPLMLGLAIAMPLARGWPHLVAVPLTLSFLFLVTAISHQLRSWLAEKMENRRTRGLVMALLPILFVTAFVLLVNATESVSFFGLLQQTPLGWLPSGIMSAESGNWMAGVLGSLAMIAIGSGFLFLSFRSGMRRFTGTTSTRKSKHRLSKPGMESVWLDSKMFISFPAVSEPVSAVAAGTLRNIRRAPEAFAALLPIVLATLFGFPFLIGMEGFEIPEWMISLLQPGLIGIALLGFPAFLFSCFSYDRDGLRAYILSPVNRDDILLGKNLGIGIPTLVLGWVSIVICQCFVPVGPFWFIGSLVSLPASYLLMCIFGNAISIFCAVGLKRGSMTPVNARIIPVIALYLGILVGPFVALLPTMLAFSLAQVIQRTAQLPMGIVYFALSLLSLSASCWVYRQSTRRFGPWLWRKETEVLEIVANIPE